MSVVDALKLSPAIAAFVTISTGLYSLTAEQRDRTMFKFTQEVLSDERHPEQHSYWDAKGQAALRCLQARQQGPGRLFVLPFAGLAYFVWCGLLMGEFWDDLAEHSTWTTVLLWPQGGATPPFHWATLTMVTAVAGWLTTVVTRL